MPLSDQPGRVLAVFVFAPLLVAKGIAYNDAVLVALGALLFAWDLYWLAFKEPARARSAAHTFSACPGVPSGPRSRPPGAPP